MREIASIELHVIAMELKSIEGMYLKKFYDLGDKKFRFTFSNKDSSMQVYCKLVKTLNRSGFSEEVQESTAFATAMRKRLVGMKLEALAQRGTDRIIVMEFSKGDERRSLIIEMFGRGNIILVNNGTIELAYSSVAQRERTIKPKLRYEFPNGNAVGYGEIGAKKIDEIIERAEHDDSSAIRAVARGFDAGPLYLENILTNASIDPKAGASQIEGREEELKEGMTKFLEGGAAPKPRVYYKDGKEIDYAIVPIRKYEGLGSKEYATLSELLDHYYMEERQAPQVAENKKLREIEVSIEKQRDLLKSAGEEEKEYAKSGKAIMSSMNELNEVISFMREHRNATLEEVRARFNNVKGLDLKNKRIVIELIE